MKRVRDVFASIDEDNNGRIDFYEFMAIFGGEGVGSAAPPSTQQAIRQRGAWGLLGPCLHVEGLLIFHQVLEAATS